MTRETRIGLLAGLAVIVVFAMILSHRGNPRGDRVPPPLVDRQQQMAAAERTPLVPPGAGAPDSSSSPAGDRVAQMPASPVETVVVEQPGAEETSLPALLDPNRSIPRPVREEGTWSAEQEAFGDALPRLLDEIVIPAPESEEEQPSNPRRAPVLPPLRGDEEPERVYVAQANDTLTRIARKLFGDGSTKRVNALYEANRDRLESKDLILVGQKLRIPATAGSGRTAGGGNGAAGPEPQPRRREHTVAPGENYSRIAQRYLGDRRRWREVYELNKDKHPDADLLPVGATIWVPSAAEPVRKLARR